MSVKQLGRYEITGTLGRGAMGVVYQAHDPLIERTVAIKTVGYAGLTPDEAEEFEGRFFREAKSAGRLNHPNIVTIHDVGRGDDLAYIAMEFLAGQSLRSLLDSGVVLPVRRIVEIASEVADGLAYAHSKGIVHRDIKPANIMVLDSGIVKIADFGIALVPSGSLTLDGTAVGSPRYMSPEQVLGKMADGRSDIFSLGTVLYEMLTGHPAFSGDDLNAILYQVLNTAPPLPSARNAGLPQGLDRIVARAMAKDPEKRYGSAGEMAADLRNYRRTPGLMQSGVKAPSGSGATRAAPKESGKTAVSSTTRKRAAASSSRKTPPARRVVPVALLVALLAGGAFLWRNQSSVPPGLPPVAVSQASAAVVSASGGQTDPVATAPEVSVEAPRKPVDEDSAAVVVARPVEPVLEREVVATIAQSGKPEPVTAATPPPLPMIDLSPQADPPARRLRTAVKASRAKAKAATASEVKSGDAKAVAESVVPVPDREPKPPMEVPLRSSPGSDWKASLRSQLAACAPEAFFSRVMCREKVRWKYCSGHWGEIDECPKVTTAEP